MEEVAIEVRNLCKSFGDNNLYEKFNLIVPYKKITCIMGQTGHGKSVLSRIIIREMEPDSGEIYVRNLKGEMIDILKLSYEQFTRQFLLTGILGIVLQSPDSLWTDDGGTVYENLARVPRDRGMKESEIEQIAKKSLDMVGLLKVSEAKSGLNEELKDKIYQTLKNTNVSTLSLGEGKRILLARELTSRYDPVKKIPIGHKIIIYDEPTTSGEPEVINKVTELIRWIHNYANNTSLIISHHPKQSVRKLAKEGDKVVLIRKGEVSEPAEKIFEGSYDEFEKMPGDYFELFRMELEGKERDAALEKEKIMGCEKRTVEDFLPARK